MTLWSALYLAAAVMCVWVAVEYTLRGRPARAAFVATLLSVAIIEALLGLGLATSRPDRALWMLRAAIAFAALPGPLVLNFAALVVGSGRPLAAARYIALGFGGLLFVATMLGDSFVAGVRQTTWGHVGNGGALLPLVIVELFGSLAPGFLILLGRIGELPRGEGRRLAYIALGFGMAVFAAIDFLPFLGLPHAPSGFVPIVFATLLLSYSIQERPLVDVSTVALNTIGWAIVSAIVFVPLLGALWATRDWAGWTEPVPAALAFYGAFHLMRFHLLRVQPEIDRAFQRRKTDLEGSAGEFAERVAVLHTAPELGRAIATALEESLYVRLCAFAIAPGKDVTRKRPLEDPDAWTLVLSAWGSVPTPDPRDPLLGYLRQNPEILLREALAHGEAQAVATEAERMFVRYRAAALLPLADRSGGGELRGIIAVGPREDGRPFSDLEIEFLQRVKTAATAAVVAARLYDRLHALHEELEAKVAARTFELERALAELRGAQGQLVQTEKMSSLGLLVSGVSADLVDAVEAAYERVPRLRQHLGACTARLGALGSAPGEEERERALRYDFIAQDLPGLLEAIDEGARRARSVARDLSRFARPGEEREEEVDLHALLDSTLNLLRHDFKGRIEVVRRYAREVPRIPGFPGPLNQVFMNLFLNAEQAIEGPGRIEVETRALEGGSPVEIVVRDTGRGIPGDNLGRIFEPFFTTKPMGSKGGGSGLGLAISYGIVERHGGRITVTSEEGRGTEFHVLLPARPGQVLGRRSLDPG